MEDDATGPDPTVSQPSPDPEIQKRLEELEREAEDLRRRLSGGESDASAPNPNNEAPAGLTDAADDSEQAQTRSSAPSALPESGQSSPEKEVAPDEPVPNTPEEIAQAEAFIRQARVARQRGQGLQATAYLKQAEAAAPNAPAVLEFIGDDYAERKMFKEARETYKKALKLAPKSVAIETKFAQTVLRTGPAIGASMMAEYEVMASRKIAVVLSALLPGLGQLVSGEIYKGIFTFVAWAGMLLWISLVPDGMAGLFAAVGITLVKGSKAEFHGIVLIPIFIAFIIWLASVMDAKLSSGMVAPKKVDRPKPLDNLPFE